MTFTVAFMAKGSITIEDARLVEAFAILVQPMLRDRQATKLCEMARTVERISYCAIADARQKERADRVLHFPEDPYTMEVSE